jgi:hypothetical protein
MVTCVGYTGCMAGSRAGTRPSVCRMRTAGVLNSGGLTVCGLGEWTSFGAWLMWRRPAAGLRWANGGRAVAGLWSIRRWRVAGVALADGVLRRVPLDRLGSMVSEGRRATGVRVGPSGRCVFGRWVGGVFGWGRLGAAFGRWVGGGVRVRPAGRCVHGPSAAGLPGGWSGRHGLGGLSVPRSAVSSWGRPHTLTGHIVCLCIGWESVAVPFEGAVRCGPPISPGPG